MLCANLAGFRELHLFSLFAVKSHVDARDGLQPPKFKTSLIVNAENAEQFCFVVNPWQDR